MIQEFSRPFGWNGKTRNIFKDFHPLRNLLTHGKRPRSNNRYTLLSRSFSAWHRSHVFARLASVICRAENLFPPWSYVFPRSPSVTCFRALGIGHMFSRAWHQSHVFGGLCNGYNFPRSWHQLHVFPLLASSKTFIHRIAHVYNNDTVPRKI